MAVLVRMGQIMKRNCQVGISLHLMVLELSDSCQTWNSREQRSGQIYLHSGKEFLYLHSGKGCSFIYTVEKSVPSLWHHKDLLSNVSVKAQDS